MRPLIGIECDHVEERRDYFKTYSAYVDAVWEAGGAPILVPSLPEPDYLDGVVDRLDGIVLIGGDDIDAVEFGQELHPEATLVSRRRYDAGRGLVDRILARRLPCLGICYGTQLINVALGGDVIQHLPEARPDALPHFGVRDDGRRGPTRHAVHLAEGSALRAAIGASEAEVASMHHQAIGRLGRGLRATATAPDGIVEAVELEAGSGFLVAVQWHPEIQRGDPAGGPVFAALIEAARTVDSGVSAG